MLRRRGAPSLLTGVPYGAKDLLATAGIPTRWGSPAHAAQVFDHDATVVERLRDAGAVLVGKLAMVELAGGGGYRFASASLHGPGLNPWDLERWSGGSSSGSGSAVAAGLVPFALGSETWGSIMSPSAFCGVTGLRPTHGVVSRHGAMALAWSMDKIGPMARTAEDCALVLAAIAGRDHRDPTTIEWAYRPTRWRRFRIGVLPNDFDGATGTARAFEEALRVLRRLGAPLREVKLPDHDYPGIGNPILGAEIAGNHDAFIKSSALDQLVDEDQRSGLRGYLELPLVDYVRATERRVAATRDLRAMFRQLDALVAPTVLVEAPTLDTDLKAQRRGGYSVLGAVAGLPALSVPMGFGPHGLPLGLSLIGDLYSEPVLLRLGIAYQRDTDWHMRRPPT